MKLARILACAVLLLPSAIFAQEEKILFSSSTDSLFRIPAVAALSNGTVVAISDYRHLHGQDVGLGKPIDILRRISTDNGRSWGSAAKAVECDGPSYAEGIFGFGDAAVVADRKSGRLMMLCVGDRLGRAYWKRGHLEVHRFVSEDGGQTWGQHSNLTDAVYSLNDSWKCLFIGSGKIFQSRVVKKGKYYRLYCSALVADYGNAVLYSDDFGASWNLLGGSESPCPKGDEPKVEELPDGSVILSSRTKGRFFNIYRYFDKSYSSGAWTGVAMSEDIIAESNSTNGEIMAVKIKNPASGRKCWLYLQSVPAGPGRSNVSIYYKILPVQRHYDDVDAVSFGKGWQRFQVTDKPSAYSTFCLQSDGRIAFLYERRGAPVDGYDIVYRAISVGEILGE